MASPGSPPQLGSPSVESKSPLARTASREPDVPHLVKEVVSLRAKVAMLEERLLGNAGGSSMSLRFERGSLRSLDLGTADDDDDDVVKDHVVRTEQISKAKKAGLSMRSSVLETLHPDVFVPEGLRSPMSRPSRFLGSKIPMPPLIDLQTAGGSGETPMRNAAAAMAGKSSRSLPEIRASPSSSPVEGIGKKRFNNLLTVFESGLANNSASPSPRSAASSVGSNLDSPKSVRGLKSYATDGSSKTASPSTFASRLKHHREMRASLSDDEAPNSMARAEENCVYLKRGGVVVPLKKHTDSPNRYIQFGIPPETIKDSFLQGFGVPQVFVVPTERFDSERGLNMAEVEFPGYFNFFMLKRQVTLVATPEAEQALRALLTETLLGPPTDHLFARDEVSDLASCPDHEKEIAYFVRPREGRSIDVDSLYKFVTFKDAVEDMMAKLDVGGGAERAPSQTMVATLDDGVEIIDVGAHWMVLENGEVVAKVNKALIRSHVEAPSRSLPRKVFIPPVFGVTVLGSSDGFDPHQRTSGFVLWIHGKGIMVDPPPDSSALLRREGISPRLVTAIVLTHCHADHDSGTFQKILLEGRIALITTKTIMASFMRKYARISMFTEMFLCRLVEPRLVRPGETMPFNGGLLTFFYSLHALPCVGFSAQVGDKTFCYSADTFYDPVKLPQLRDERILSHGRCQALLDFPFASFDVCLHEAGIPPIHTAIKTLEALPDEAKRGLYIIHVTDAVASRSKLKLAKPGTEHTIEITPPSKDIDVLCIHALTQSELFFPSRVRQTMRFSSLAPSKLNSETSPHDFDWLDALQTHGGGSVLSRDTAQPVLRFGSSKQPAVFPSPSSSPQLSRPAQPFYTGAPDARRSSLMDGIEISDLSLAQVSTILLLAARIERSAGELVTAPVGQRDSYLFIVARGFCRVDDPRGRESLRDDEEPPEGPDGTLLEVGDNFGLMGRNIGLPRRCEIKALTDVILLGFDEHALRYLSIVHPHWEGRMSHIRQARASESWRILDLNSTLSRLVASQRAQLQSVASETLVEAGSMLWQCGRPASNMYIVAEGELVFLDEDGRELLTEVIKPGGLFCNVPSMIRQRAGLVDGEDVDSSVTLMARTRARLFKIRNLDALAFLERNPGLMVQMFPNLLVE